MTDHIISFNNYIKIQIYHLIGRRDAGRPRIWWCSRNRQNKIFNSGKAEEGTNKIGFLNPYNIVYKVSDPSPYSFRFRQFLFNIVRPTLQSAALLVSYISAQCYQNRLLVTMPHSIGQVIRPMYTHSQETLTTAHHSTYSHSIPYNSNYATESSFLIFHELKQFSIRCYYSWVITTSVSLRATPLSIKTTDKFERLPRGNLKFKMRCTMKTDK